MGERDTGTEEEAVLVVLSIHLLSAYCVPGSKPGARNSKGAGRVRVSYQVISDTVLTEGTDEPFRHNSKGLGWVLPWFSQQ